MSRLIARKTKRAGLIVLSRNASSIPRPYKFHIGASWAGKPSEPGPKLLNVSYAADSAIGTWRDKVLSRPKTAVSKDAGEDFFYIQEVTIIFFGLGCGTN